MSKGDGHGSSIRIPFSALSPAHWILDWLPPAGTLHLLWTSVPGLWGPAYATSSWLRRVAVAPPFLASNLFTFLYSIFYYPSIVLEGFGAGAYTVAVAALSALSPPPWSRQSPPESVLISMGGVSMHPPTFCQLIQAHTAVHNHDLQQHALFLAPRQDPMERDADYKRPFEDPPEFNHAFLIVQHVHDRASPWTLSPLLLSYLYNLGIKVPISHDDVAPQQEQAQLHNGPFSHSSHFGPLRHNYERIVPTLKTFSCSTFFTNFLLPLTYEQLEAREGSLGAAYCPDLFDLLFGLLSYIGKVPTPTFGAQPKALVNTLLHGCHRPPNTFTPLFHGPPELHEAPLHFCIRSFIHLLRLPSLALLGLPQDDIHSIEESLKNALLMLPLPQALDMLQTQLLSSLCVAIPKHELHPPSGTSLHRLFPLHALGQ